jgi:hypothetical protein
LPAPGISRPEGNTTYVGLSQTIKFYHRLPSAGGTVGYLVRSYIYGKKTLARKKPVEYTVFNSSGADGRISRRRGKPTLNNKRKKWRQPETFHTPRIHGTRTPLLH